MVKVTIFFSAALIVLGFGGFLLSHASSGAYAPTALIPAVVGVLMLICGGVALNAKYRMHAMHGSILVATLGFLGAMIPGVKMLIGARKPTEVLVLSVCGLLALTAVYIALCVRSFRAARIARQRGEATAM